MRSRQRSENVVPIRSSRPSRGERRRQRPPDEATSFLQGFTRFSNDIFGETGLCSVDLAVLVAISSFTPGRTNQRGEWPPCWASIARIADRAKCSPRSVGASLNRLEEKAFIYRERRGKGLTNNIYIVLNRAAFLKARKDKDEAYAHQIEKDLHHKVVRLQAEYYSGQLSAEAYNASIKALEITDPRCTIPDDKK